MVQDGRVEVLAGRGESLNLRGIAAAGVGTAAATSVVRQAIAAT
jgi:hypothetical protein